MSEGDEGRGTARSTDRGPREQPAEQVDGRRERGEASRRCILAAASEVIVDAGVGGLTHRAVAERAGVPLARVSYHYSTIDELLEAATSHYLDAFDERLTTAAHTTLASGRPILDACTDFLADLTGPGAAEFLSMVEIRLALHRRGRVVDEQHVIGTIASLGIEPAVAGSIVASMFGFALIAATTDEPVTTEQIRAHVELVLAGVLATTAFAPTAPAPTEASA